MCYIFEKHGIQGYKIWYSHVSNVKYTNTRLHKYANTQIQSAQKTLHVLYFWKTWDSRISNMIFPCVKCKIHNYKNTQIRKAWDSRISNMTFPCINMIKSNFRMQVMWEESLLSWYFPQHRPPAVQISKTKLQWRKRRW